MDQEINEIIKKNLPAQVGEVLKQRLEQAERDATDLKKYAADLAEANATVSELKIMLVRHKSLDERAEALTAREIAVDVLERAQKISQLQYELESEKQKTDFVKNVALGLVRNTEYRKNIFDSETQSGHYNENGMWIQPTPVNKAFEEKSTTA